MGKKTAAATREYYFDLFYPYKGKWLTQSSTLTMASLPTHSRIVQTIKADEERRFLSVRSEDQISPDRRRHQLQEVRSTPCLAAPRSRGIGHHLPPHSTVSCRQGCLLRLLQND